VNRFLIVIVTLLAAPGCGKEPGSTRLTEGRLVIECDESVLPPFEKMAAEFGEQYPDAHITLRPAEARAAIADFFNDTVRVIVTGRPFNREEREMLSAAKVEFQEWHVAQSAVALIGHRESGVSRLRMSEADSLFSGVTTRVSGRKKGPPIELVVGDINASTNEAFRAEVMGGRKYTVTVTPMKSSADIVRYVTQTPNTLGIVGIAWLKGFDNRVTVVELGGSAYRPDTTRAPGQYYAPAQAYVFQGFYPVGTPVYIYSRAVDRDLGLGFISFATSAAGQKIITREGLVPVTMPVRLVQLTSDQVK
jgi:phosphate transport system substrate-binding protein